MNTVTISFTLPEDEANILRQELCDWVLDNAQGRLTQLEAKEAAGTLLDGNEPSTGDPDEQYEINEVEALDYYRKLFRARDALLDALLPPSIFSKGAHYDVTLDELFAKGGQQ